MQFSAQKNLSTRTIPDFLKFVTPGFLKRIDAAPLALIIIKWKLIRFTPG